MGKMLKSLKINSRIEKSKEYLEREIQLKQIQADRESQLLMLQI